LNVALENSFEYENIIVMGWELDANSGSLYYNSTLPTSFLLTIQNIDFDGIESVVFVDFIIVTTGD